MTKAPFKLSKIYTVPANGSLSVTESFNGILINTIKKQNVDGVNVDISFIGESQNYAIIDGGDAFMDNIFDVAGTFGEPVEADSVQLNLTNSNSSDINIEIEFIGLIPKRK